MVVESNILGEADVFGRLTPLQRLLYDQLPAICKQTPEQRQELAAWFFHQPHLFRSGGDEEGIQLATGAESMLLLQQIAGQFPAFQQQVGQLQQQLGRRGEPTHVPTQLKPDEFARQVTRELHLKEQVLEAVEQVITQTAERGLNAMVNQVHRRIDESASPALITARRYHRLQMELWGLMAGFALLVGVLVLAYHKASYFQEGFYKYELVRYRALLPGHSGYRSLFEEVEKDFDKPNFLDNLAGMEALYSRLGTTTRSSQGGMEKEAKRTSRKAN